MHLHARIHMYLLLSQAEPFMMKPAKRGVAHIAITVDFVFPQLLAITVYFLFPELPTAECFRLSLLNSFIYCVSNDSSDKTLHL